MSKVRLFQDPKQRKRLGSDNCPWSVEWRENGRRRSKTIGQKDKAEDFATRKRAELLDKETGVRTTKLWAEFVDEYEAQVVARFPSHDSRRLTRQIVARFTAVSKPRYVHRIDRQLLDEYVAKRLTMPGKKRGDTLSPASVRKELRHIRAALGTAKEWNYLREVPRMPRVKGVEKDKRFVTEADFNRIMDACDRATKPDPRIHPGVEPATWWRALLAVAWTTGMRIGALLALRWEDVDLETGVLWSRGRDNKGKRDMPHDAAGAVEFLRGLPATDPRVFPWNHDRRTLDAAFHAIQRAAGIHLPCPEQHEHTDACHVYGFHDVRRAHATYNYGKVPDRALQQQMGHASFQTTQGYIRYAELHKGQAYPAHLPDSLQAGPEQRENGGKDSGKPAFRVVGA